MVFPKRVDTAAMLGGREHRQGCARTRNLELLLSVEHSAGGETRAHDPVRGEHDGGGTARASSAFSAPGASIREAMSDPS